MAYVTISDELNDRQLSANEKIALALIQGFGQDNQGIFYGSINYISWWLGTSRMTTIRTLRGLVEKGLVEKGEIEENGIRRCTYKLTSTRGYQNDTGIKMIRGEYQNDNAPGIKMIPDNTINNTIDNTISSSNPIRPTIESLQSDFRKTLDLMADEYTPQMMQEFFDYWAAPLQNPTAAQVKKGILLKFQTMDTWNLPGRLRTWQRKSNDIARKNAGITTNPRLNSRGETKMVEAYRLANESMERAMTAASERRMAELEERTRP